MKDGYSFLVNNGETRDVALSLEAGDRLVGSFTVDGGTIDFWVKDPFGVKILGRDDRSSQQFALIAATDGIYKLYFYNGAWFSDYMVTLNATRYPSRFGVIRSGSERLEARARLHIFLYAASRTHANVDGIPSGDLPPSIVPLIE